ncbi:MAG: hypothetical protein WAR79_14210 [Melioribacteraceae bacterium]
MPLEFTNRNTDSLSLETLKFIFNTAKEYYSDPANFEASELEENEVKMSAIF